MTEPQYIPGGCNLGPVEIRRRYRIGYTGTAIALLFALIIHLADLPQWKFMIFFPVYYALSGFIQARNKFCYIYGYKGVASLLGRKKFEKIRDEENLKKDKRLARKIILQVVVGSILITLLYYFLPI